MTVIMNPFDAGGYSLAEMTEAINILPNIYTRLGQMGLFRFEGLTQRSGRHRTGPRACSTCCPPCRSVGPATVANRDTRSMRSFTIPWIPHDDVITPQDIQGVRGFGVADAADPLATTMERKLTRMRAKHAQTREYMEGQRAARYRQGRRRDDALQLLHRSLGLPRRPSTSCSAPERPTSRPKSAVCCVKWRPNSRARP